MTTPTPIPPASEADAIVVFLDWPTLALWLNDPAHPPSCGRSTDTVTHDPVAVSDVNDDADDTETITETENLCLRCCERYGESHFDPDGPDAWICLTCRLKSQSRRREALEAHVVNLRAVCEQALLFFDHRGEGPQLSSSQMWELLQNELIITTPPQAGAAKGES